VVNTLQKPQLLTKGTCLGNPQMGSIVAATVPKSQPLAPDSVIPGTVDRLPDKLTSQQRTAVRDHLIKYEDVFSKNEFDTGGTPPVEYHIDTGDSRPIRQQLRRQPLKHLEAIDENFKTMLANGIIEPATSPWFSNVVIATKKNGSLRFCVDYQAVNSVTYTDSYPLPHIDNCLNAMNGASWFTTLDLRSGYHNIPVTVRDRDKMAFVTRRGC